MRVNSLLNHYAMLAKRWAWLVLLGIVLCGGITYGISKRTPPVYEASAIIVINLGASSSSALDSVSASQLVAATYAQLLTGPQVLNPVVALHRGLTLPQLSAMVTVKTQPNTELIEVDVDNSDPDLAARLANEVEQSFAYYVNTQLSGGVQIIPAVRPTSPIRPKPSLYAGIGALVGLGLSLTLIVIFEWIDDRLVRPEEVQEILGMETLATIPKLSNNRHIKKAAKIPLLAENCHILCTGLNAAQAAKPFKLVMVTSALPAEGKSTIAANLASILALTGKRVLLVDASLRHPTIDQYFQLDNSQGVSDALEEAWPQIETKLNGQETDIPTLRVLTTGIPHSNPAELLQSPLAKQLLDHFKKAPFDYIILDTAPLLPVADTQILAAHSEAIVLVVDASKTPRRSLQRVKHLLDRTWGMRKVGVVINKSHWSEYIDRRFYLKNTLPSKPAVSKGIPPQIPPTNGAEDCASKPTDTLPADSVVDEEATIVVARHKWPEVNLHDPAK